MPMMALQEVWVHRVADALKLPTMTPISKDMVCHITIGYWGFTYPAVLWPEELTPADHSAYLSGTGAVVPTSCVFWGQSPCCLICAH